MVQPVRNEVYVIELCSGERRRWQYLGPDGRGVDWWKDVESGQEFHEGSLMYAWQIVEEGEAPAWP